MKQVTHLHFHTEYSLLDSLIQIKDIPELLQKVDTKALVLTDHGNVDGAIKFYTTLKKETKTIPLLGCEFYVVDDLHEKKDKKRYHMVAIAKNRKGFSSIMRALTVANLEGFYYRPRIDWKYMMEEMNDVVLMTACLDGLFAHPNYALILDEFYKKFKDDFYLEAIMLEDMPRQHERNKLVKDIHDATGIKIAVTNDVHYEKSEDWQFRDVTYAIRYNDHIDPKKELIQGKDTNQLYFKNYDQMINGLKAFDMGDYEEKMVEVWDEIVNKCTFELERMQVSVPVAYEEAKDNPEEYFSSMVRNVFYNHEKFKGDKDAEERMEYELKEICELGFAEYFLLVADICAEAKKRDIMVGAGRGSVGGSLVAYLLSITGVNPLEFNLVFERFISPGRHDLPDIDLDFEDTKRDVVIDYLKEKYGERNVALVATYATLKGKGAVRDVSRVYNVPLVDVNACAKQILVRFGGDERSDFTVEDTIRLFEVAKEFNEKYSHVIEAAKRLEGLLKNKSTHAAGVVTDTTDLYTGEKCVLLQSKTGEMMVNWDKKDLEYMGLMKMDILGLRTLNVLHEIQRLVKERKGVDIEWHKLPLDDEKIINRFAVGDSIGTFQFGSPGMIQYLRDFNCKNFTELYQAVALYRPGILRSGMSHQFIQLKRGEKKPEYVNDELKKILEETYGVVLFQEQMMYIFNRLGGIPWHTVDVVRKVVSKSEGQEKFETFRQTFLDGVKKLKSMSQEDANRIFSIMKFFGSYSFNKSHSVEYTMLGWWTMWAKVYHPLEFYCINLQRARSGEDISNYLSDVNKAGIKVKSPQVNESDSTWKIEDETTLRAGFEIIKGISATLGGEIIRAREMKENKQFESYTDFINSVNRRLVNIARIKVLLMAGAFGDLLSPEEHELLYRYIETFRKCPESVEEAKKKENELIEVDVDLGDIFNYELTGSFFEFNKKFIGILKDKYDVKKLEIMRKILETGTLPLHWYICKFDELKYGYRHRVGSEKDYDKKDFIGSKGFAGDLGGVYGIIRDDSYLCYATISKPLFYSGMKAKIEDMAGKYILMKADKPTKASNLFVHEIYFLNDIKEGKFIGVKIVDEKAAIVDFDLKGVIGISEIEEGLENETKKCSECLQRDSCQAPVSFSKGMFNALIVGEAPGADEDEQGKGFVGKAGRILWKELKEFALEREWFYISNIQKCRPKDNKITEQATAFKCADRWLQKEIGQVRPRIILSLGKTAYQYFSGDKKGGITQANGKVEWSDKYGAWMIYSVHPASAIYTDENAELLRFSLEKFNNLFKKLLPE